MTDAAGNRDDDITADRPQDPPETDSAGVASNPQDGTAESRRQGGAKPILTQPATDQLFTLRPPPPVRALAISAAAAVAGAVVIVLATHSAVVALGAILLGFGVLLAVAALVLTSRLRSTVRLTSDGLEVTRGGRTGSLAWIDIDRVQERGHRLIAIARDGGRDLVITVPVPRGASYARLLHAIKQHLDDSRGYGH